MVHLKFTLKPGLIKFTLKPGLIKFTLKPGLIKFTLKPGLISIETMEKIALLEIEFCWRQIFEILIIEKPSLGSCGIP